MNIYIYLQRERKKIYGIYIYIISSNQENDSLYIPLKLYIMQLCPYVSNVYEDSFKIRLDQLVESQAVTFDELHQETTTANNIMQ